MFEFTLKFGLPDVSVDPNDYIAQLAAAGCDDALIGVGQTGRIVLDFSRESQSAFAAITSAFADVKCAIPDAILIEAVPDLVGLTDVADIVGCSRQNMRKLMLASGPDFPLPVHEGKSALWRLYKVLVWLKECKHYQVEETLLDVARTNMQFNMAKETKELEPKIQRAIQSLFT